MLEKITTFLDRLAGLPYWQTAVLVILVAGAAVGGYFVLRPAPRPAGEFVGAREAEEEAAEGGGGTLAVHVAGAVAHPGVVLLREGDRVVDAIEAAGGPLPEADLDSLNLAQEVQDGQKVAVPLRGEPGDAGEPGGGQAQRKVNLNTAGQKELEELPGIGPTLAERILAYREKRGGFKSVEELKQVSGIGEKKFEEIRDLVEI